MDLMTPTPVTSATGLGPTIRAWRDRLPPSAAALPVGRTRRAAGLRREELAELAGMSVDYVVRLEQGRATTPSAQVVASLARALQLAPAERDHLYRLAGLVPPADGTVSHHIPPGVHRVLSRLGDVPVAVFAADWQMIWWNHSWAALLGDPSPSPLELRNFARDRFPVDPGPPRLASWPDSRDCGRAERWRRTGRTGRRSSTRRSDRWTWRATCSPTATPSSRSWS
jgi:PAS domain-containing protein